MSWKKIFTLGVAAPAVLAAGLSMPAVQAEENGNYNSDQLTTMLTEDSSALMMGGEFLQFSTKRVAPTDGMLILDTPSAADLPHIDITALFDFCANNRTECAPVKGNDDSIVITMLTKKTMADLNQVNNEVNAIPYEDDEKRFGESDYWSLDGSDCEDKSFEKRRRLIDMGYDPRSMYVAFVEVPGQGAHAVLGFRTDQGDQILDNYNPEVMTVEKTGFVFVAATSRTHPWEVYPVIHEGDRMLLPSEQIASAIEQADAKLYAPIDDSAAPADLLPSQRFGMKLPGL